MYPWKRRLVSEYVGSCNESRKPIKLSAANVSSTASSLPTGWFECDVGTQFPGVVLVIMH